MLQQDRPLSLECGWYPVSIALPSLSASHNAQPPLFREGSAVVTTVLEPVTECLGVPCIGAELHRQERERSLSDRQETLPPQPYECSGEPGSLLSLGMSPLHAFDEESHVNDLGSRVQAFRRPAS
jgi:hypothetical protein